MWVFCCYGLLILGLVPLTSFAAEDPPTIQELSGKLTQMTAQFDDAAKNHEKIVRQLTDIRNDVAIVKVRVSYRKGKKG